MPLLAHILLPVPIQKPFTYLVPELLATEIKEGMRVEVQFGKNKLYSGLVYNLESTVEAPTNLKPVLGLLDDAPIIYRQQLDLWQWMAKYYVSSIGEIMAAALPAGFKLSSDTFLVYNPTIDWTSLPLTDEEFLLAEALSIQHKLSIQELQDILQKKSVLQHTKKLISLSVAFWEEELEKKYAIKWKEFVCLKDPYHLPENAGILLEKVQRSEKQVRAILYLLQQQSLNIPISKKKWFEESQIEASVCKKLIEKGLIDITKTKDSRLHDLHSKINPDLLPLTSHQSEALTNIKKEFADKNICLLHGVTGSGKTRVYQELINEVVAAGGQVLYLLPEISLSTQMENRLKLTYGHKLLSYHSRINLSKKVEIWQAVYNGHPIILSARSGIFLPFKNLQLIIVDEEHDASYKQADPSPYYHARDVALYLANQYMIKVILGTATPSVETYFNGIKEKYGVVKLSERYGNMELPEIQIVDIREEKFKGKMNSVFSNALLKEIEAAYESKRNIILFQNRRGYAPVYQCQICLWKAECNYCDITMTHHKYNNTLKCHYCNYTTMLPAECPKCASRSLDFKGFGTEKIEDELKILYPDLIVKRFDADSTSSGGSLSQILDSFANNEINVLVGTQMVTKGLDFDNVGLVGILNADAMLYYPDFRSNERTFQLMVQVAGRAGRKNQRGKVILQTSQPQLPMVQDIKNMNLIDYYTRELEERKKYLYPPYSKLIKITIKHKDSKTLHSAANYFSGNLRNVFGNRVTGPAMPPIGRIKNMYLLQIYVKMEKDAKLITNVKTKIIEYRNLTLQQKGKSNVRFMIDVDPYHN
jgi:primosomal protein N' (replication factor Y) (superfamily II helicase)